MKLFYRGRGIVFQVVSLITVFTSSCSAYTVCSCEKIMLSMAMCFLVRGCTAADIKCKTVKYVFVFSQYVLW